MPGSYFSDCSVLPSFHCLRGGRVPALLPAVAGSWGRTPVALFMADLSERTVIYCVSSSAAVNLQRGNGAVQWNPNFQPDTGIETGELAGRQ